MKLYQKELSCNLNIQFLNILANNHALKTSEILWIDIETTGFSASCAYVYLIGCIFYENEKWKLFQWFLEDNDISAEKELLSSFSTFLSSFSYLIHFNGNVFDIPFLKKRMKRYKLSTECFTSLKNFDLYKEIRPLKRLLHLSNLKQKNLEEFFHFYRKDNLSNKELLQLYEAYLEHPSNNLQNSLLFHNSAVLEGMLCTFPIYSYLLFLSGEFEIKQCQVEQLENKNDILSFLLLLSYPIPKSISYHWGECTLAAREYTVSLHIKIFHGELKYFYSNYKEYYYLPLEDKAVHKSVAAYVDKNYREKAKLSNCYTKKSGNFLPQIAEWFLPSFRENYRSDCLYFELTKEFLADRETQKKYLLYQFSQI